MGSVVDYVRCPQCGGVYFRDYNYRTQEEYRACCRCGKVESWRIERDEAGNVVFNENREVHYIEESHFGFGAGRLMKTSGFGTVFHFDESVDSEIQASFQEALVANKDLDESQCYLTSWDADKGDVIAVFGEVPPLYEEYFDEEIDEDLPSPESDDGTLISKTEN